MPDGLFVEQSGIYAGKAPPWTPKARRLASRDPDDHPHAQTKRCSLRYPHEAHPYGRIDPRGGLANWCRGSARH